jgi:hypothetical protein
MVTEKTSLLIGVAHEARSRGLRPRDRELREILRLAKMWWDEGSEPPHKAAKLAGLAVMRDRRKRPE